MTTIESNPAGTSDAHAGKDSCRISGVGLSYGNRVALKDVSFTAERGQMVAVVGQSGAGKTTLLRIIAGMLQPDTGEVSLYGVQPYALKDSGERTRLVGMMQQRLDLVSELSARHNADAGMLGRWNLFRSLAALALPIKNPSTTAALERVGLAGRESERVSKLSGGEQQRVAMARVLVQDPEVIVADEPVASLDPDLAGELLGLLRSIALERGRTVIASIHDPRLAQTHFDRVIGLREGVLQFDLAASELTPEHLDELYERGRDDRSELSESDGERPLWGI